MSQERIHWIDTAKGIGIILVILGHLGTGVFGRWIYSFHIPLFFFLSGYVFNCKQEFGKFLLKKVKSILIPYFCLGVPLLIFDTLLTNESFFDLALKFLLQQRQWTIWFLSCLFVLNILLYWLLRYINNLTVIGLLSVAAAFLCYAYYYFGGNAVIWNIDIALMAMPFFFTGLLFKRKFEGGVFANIHKYSLITLLLSCNLVLICFCGTIDMFGASYGLFPLTYVSAFLGIFFIVEISKLIHFHPFEYIGQNSMLYFAWHQSICFPLVFKLLSLFNFCSGNSSVGFMMCTKLVELILILIMLTLFNEILVRIKWLSFVIGK